MTSTTYGFIAAIVLLIIYELIKKRRDSFHGEKILQFKENTNKKKSYRSPNITLIDENNLVVKTKNLNKMPLVLTFWNTKKKKCKKNLSAINDLYEVYGDKVLFLNIYISNGDDETIELAKEYKELNGLDFPIYFDNSKQYEFYDVHRVPEMVFITDKRYISKIESGELTKDRIERQIRLLLK